MAANRTIVVSGKNERPDVVVDGFGKAKVMVNFNMITKSIIEIKFEGNPDIQTSIKKKVAVKGEELRHIRSREWTKQSLKAKYENQSVLELIKAKNEKFEKSFGGAIKATSVKSEVYESDYASIASDIAKEYLKQVAQSIANVSSGDKYHNNFLGKMILLLKPYVEAGKNGFKDNTKIDLSKKINLFNDADFYKTVREELCRGITDPKLQYLEIPNWDRLLEIYFAVNYDLTELSAKGKTGNKEYENYKGQLRKAKEEFLNIYSIFGSYDYQPSETKAITTSITDNNNNNNTPVESEESQVKNEKDSESPAKKLKTQESPKAEESEEEEEMIEIRPSNN